ncbi:Crp/Fnr family transcriptional regulator [Antarcticimicrobium luteum]|uniref:Crp/Fnr family transcriptional regulator n=1 Tax=Antarcticimicrobium luteum TaxID=2547397 RepID=A0A4R5UYK6_9RHOB|nr:Crp/Fnr family transcriptional regulator [Antarcticimicrobium luteum]TDK44480.1 Crp/Fnr family transcriptional regulator [Antarcticimicrobium luteum]
MVHKHHEEIARNSVLLRSLPDQHVEPLLSRAICHRYDRGETLFLQDEPADAIHIVLEGWVKLYRVTPNGNEAVVSVFTRGESFGEAVALRRLPYPVSAEAATSAEVLHLPTSVLVDLIKRDAEVGLSILSSTFIHLHSLVAQLEQLKAQTGAQRVAEFLLDLCACDDGGCVVKMPYDKVLIAGRLGMKPESLSRAFARLKRSGVTIEKSRARIESIERLRELVDNCG